MNTVVFVPELCLIHVNSLFNCYNYPQWWCLQLLICIPMPFDPPIHHPLGISYSDSYYTIRYCNQLLLSKINVYLDYNNPLPTIVSYHTKLLECIYNAVNYSLNIMPQHNNEDLEELTVILIERTNGSLQIYIFSWKMYKLYAMRKSMYILWWFKLLNHSVQTDVN